jgi:hypothetical protein
LIISLLCLRLMCFQVISTLSRRLKEKWSLRRRQGFHSTLSVSSTLRHHSTLNWYNLHSYHSYQRGEKNKCSQKTPFLAINAKGGEILSPKQKDRTTNFKFFEIKFSLGIFQISIPLETIFQLVSIFLS